MRGMHPVVRRRNVPARLGVDGDEVLRSGPRCASIHGLFRLSTAKRSRRVHIVLGSKEPTDAELWLSSLGLATIAAAMQRKEGREGRISCMAALSLFEANVVPPPYLPSSTFAISKQPDKSERYSVGGQSGQSMDLAPDSIRLPSIRSCAYIYAHASYT